MNPMGARGRNETDDEEEYRTPSDTETHRCWKRGTEPAGMDFRGQTEPTARVGVVSDGRAPLQRSPTQVVGKEEGTTACGVSLNRGWYRGFFQ